MRGTNMAEDNKEDNVYIDSVTSMREQTETQRKYGFMSQKTTEISKKKLGFAGDDKTSIETLFGMK